MGKLKLFTNFVFALLNVCNLGIELVARTKMWKFLGRAFRSVPFLYNCS